MTANAYFICCLLLMLVILGLFLAGGYGERPKLIQVEERLYLWVPGTLFISAFLLPTLFPFSIACGGLGCTQRWLPIPELLKRLLAYSFAAGLLLQGLAGYLWTTNLGSELPAMQRSRWIGFIGLFGLVLPLLAHLYGVAVRIRGEKEMKASKFYGLGGLLMLVWISFSTFWQGWPWLEPQVVGLTAVRAGLITWPLGAALGAAALFLAVLQSAVAAEERVKVGAAIAYFLGSGVFLVSLHRDLLRDRPWDEPMSWTTAAGLTLLLFVFLTNFLGMLRREQS